MSNSSNSSANVAQITVPAHQTYNAQPAAAPSGSSVNLTLTVKETMISIARGITTFDARSSFSTWAYRIATNVSLDELRRRRRRLPVDAAGTPGGAGGAELPGDRLDRLGGVAAGRPIDQVGDTAAASWAHVRALIAAESAQQIDAALARF